MLDQQEKKEEIMKNYYPKFSDLLGMTLQAINVDRTDNADHQIIFTTITGDIYKMHHEQDCCENVRIEDINGDITDLVGHPLTQAEEVTDSDDPRGIEYPDSFTWTFYKLATVKGYVTIRWLGESNGYYSESVDFFKVN